MRKYQGLIVTCTLCALTAAPALAQVTGGPSPSSPSAPNQQAPTGTRPDSATGSTSLPGTAAPGTPTDDKGTTLGRQDSGSAGSNKTGSGMKGSDTKGLVGSGISGSGTAQPTMSTSGTSGVHHNASTEQVRQMQEALKAQGKDPGPVDGMMGARTQEALRAYQGSKNLSVTGQLDAATMEQLGVRGSGTDSRPRTKR